MCENIIMLTSIQFVLYMNKKTLLGIDFKYQTTVFLDDLGM